MAHGHISVHTFLSRQVDLSHTCRRSILAVLFDSTHSAILNLQYHEVAMLLIMNSVIETGMHDCPHVPAIEAGRNEQTPVSLQGAQGMSILSALDNGAHCAPT